MQAIVRTAAVQMNAGLDKRDNLATSERLIRQAAQEGAQLVVLPELFNAYGPLADVVTQAEPIPGPTSELCAALARELGITLCAGSLCERSAQANRGYNTSLLFTADGKLAAKYRKQHLFDVEIPGSVSSRESDHMLPGEELRVVALPLGNIGQAICYDLRFPELFRELSRQSLEILLLPSAFTATTGRDHWDTLVCARAIENQCFVIAANQYGKHGAALESYGGSLILDPWGDVLAQAPLDSEAIIHAELTHERLEQVRTRVPVLGHRRM